MTLVIYDFMPIAVRLTCCCHLYTGIMILDIRKLLEGDSYSSDERTLFNSGKPKPAN